MIELVSLVIGLIIGTALLWQAYRGTKERTVAILGAGGWGAFALSTVTDGLVTISVLGVAILLFGVAALSHRRANSQHETEVA